MDTSQANALFDLERIFTNMKKALADFKIVKKLQDELLFYGAQLRDGKLYIFISMDIYLTYFHDRYSRC